MGALRHLWSKIRVCVFRWSFGDCAWQGAYVFNLSIEEGLILKDGITQFESSAGLLNSDIYFSSPYYVKRALYIDNVLATILRARAT